jgi:sialate O-acetylesterase
LFSLSTQLPASVAAPAAPVGVTAMGRNLSNTLAWPAVAGVDTYTVKRSLWNGGPYTTLASNLTATSFTDSGLLNGTAYHYVVTATTAGIESPASLQASAIPQAALPTSALPLLHPIFADHVVLQRDALAPIWGWTTAGTQVTVTINGQTRTTTANVNGRWQVEVGPFSAGGPYTLSVTGPQSVTVSDVLFGDVWICSGQSNMERQLGPRSGQPDVLNYQAEAAAANFPNIRVLAVPQVAKPLPAQTLDANWTVCSPTSVLNLSAVGYFMARDLHQTLNVPIGLLWTAWGGTRIDAWLETQEAAAFPEFRNTLYAQPALATGSELGLGHLYNSMVAPLAPFRAKGVVWYQGEYSADRAEQYSRLLPALMSGWRRAWGQPELPFVVVQLPNYNGGSTWPNLREAQLTTVQTDPLSRLVTTIDVGDPADIHPANKQDVGKRAARAALDVANGQTLVSQGPLFTGATVEGGTIRCAFSNVGGGLMVGSKTALTPTTEVVGGTLNGFTIAGADKSFVAANAVIDNATHTVVVSSASVPAPLYVRYAWAANPTCNLYNKIVDGTGAVIDGLPASPFRNDPIARLAVVNGTGFNTYAPGAQTTVTASSVANATFARWYGDTAQLANPNAANTTATLSRSYVSIGADYLLTTAPTGLTATAASLQNTLAWTALANANSYTIKRASANGGPYTTIATGVLTTSYTDTTTGYGTPYYYVVSANTPGGETPNSIEVTATALSPSAPNGGVAIAGNTVVSLTWNAVPNVTGYVVKRGTGSGGPYSTTVHANVAGTTYVDTGLINGTAVYYTIAASYGAFVGPASSEIAATPTTSTIPIKRSTGGLSAASSAPVSTESAVQAFDGSTATKWFTTVSPTASPVWLKYQFGNGAAWTVTRYDIASANDVAQRDPKDWQLLGSNDGANWTVLDTRTGESFASRFLNKTYTFTNTTPYRYHRLNVTANSGGSAYGVQLSEFALYSNSTDTGDKTAPVLTLPTNITTPATSASGATVSFTLSANDGVSGAVPPVCSPASGSTFPIGTTTVQSTATDAAGNIATGSFTITVTPAPPTGLTATGGNAQIALSWTASAGATGYAVYRSTVSGTGYALVGTPSGTTFTDTGRAIGTTYYYVVTATVSGGASSNSIETAATTYSALQAWRQQHFGTIAATGTAADDADPDGDGRKNKLEYATGSNPTTADGSPATLLGTTANEQKLTLTFQRIADPSLTYTVEATDDLTSAWTTIWSSTGGSNVPGAVTVEDFETISTHSKRFLRLKISP